MSEPGNGAAGAAAAAAANQPRFGIQRIYLKDLSFESPSSPGIFGENWQPKAHLDLNTRTEQQGPDRYEVVLTVTLKAENAAGKSGYIVEVQQAGVFEIANLNRDQLAQTLGTLCPNILFPYARETIDSLIVRGTFAPVMLAPVNFDALYAEAQKHRVEAPVGQTH